ncbi:LEAF RUST 10 DISEASE-RESISTANCE LOCUS RECEPTOR-LIKE PROTEIN KINASE-like 1.5 [Andrographis paniculata]|uniref:LEAF RUST 10 DISEASE-RESISTANCE LOCUS RECEPTOR-LIKE PROTEIN KINASE-like 1.5 n=1 Tax=Andrographis paniculata TaxID=175694 RepID=UPI0021E97197|nr:LEAF RUST 10 DISEASE-RESISTANCE LOCUS RECEPTOR-LIKE PROTEIN KINASE-like 1.5 [Andrographis paniculata]
MSPPSSAVLILLAALFPAVVSSHSCSSPPAGCPPFDSPPPFPFSSLPGCGHPSFQIHCLPSSRAAISIGEHLFSVLQYEPNSTSLTLSPAAVAPPPPPHRNCTPSSTISYLNGSISFSGTKFRISDSSCSRLSALRPCPPPNLPDCRRCSWECNLINTPTHLIRECAATRRRDDDQSICQRDVLGDLDAILKLGFEVEWEEEDRYFSSCKSCQAVNGVCGFNSSDLEKPFVCFTSKPPIRQKSPNRIAILFITVFFVFFLIALVSSVVVFRSKRKTPTEEDPTAIFLRRHRSAAAVFTYEELAASTNHFDLKRKIGDGGFGSVYLGHLHDGRLVAVKHLRKHNSAAAGAEKGFSKKSFCNEILILSSINHPNLVKLHGYCSDPRGLLLVYDYVPNGTLADHLHGNHRKGALTWKTRVDIALQTAMAIEYLHFSLVPPVVHRDITSSNIFVEKDMRVKLGDFGLSRLLICSESPLSSKNTSDGVWTGPQGTPGYLDPDYYRSFMLNEKSDVYSFGVVLLELMTGMRAVDQNREKREITLVDMVVPRIQTGLLHQVVDPVFSVDREAMEGVCAVAELAFQCLAADKDDRPNARDVVAELRRIKGCRSSTGSVLRSSNSSNVVVPDGV